MKHGFPLLTHPDEATIINPVVNMTRAGSLNPGNFNRPDQFLYYLNFIVLNLISYIAYGVNIAEAYGSHTLDFYFYSRFLISIMGSLIPVVAYLIGKQIKPHFALPAAVTFALFPLYIEHSVYITPDIPITLLTMVIMYFVLRYVNTDKNQYLIIATIFAAINTSEKYPGAISFAIIIAGIALQSFRNKTNGTRCRIKPFILQILKVGLIYVVSLFIVAPYTFLDYNSVLNALIRESRSTHLGADSLGWLGNLWFYVKTFYKYMNVFGVILLAIGIYGLARSKQKTGLILLYGFLYWLLLSVLALHWERWALPMYIAPLFLIAIGISTLWGQRKRHIIVLLTSIIIIICYLLPQGVHTVYIPVRMKFTDTRLISQIYCNENDITRYNNFYEGYTPLMPANFGAVFTNFSKFEGQYDYIILSSYIYDRYYAEPERYSEQIDIYEQIRAENILTAIFEPTPSANHLLDQLENILYFVKFRIGLTDQVRLNGPTIKIFKSTK
jgi:hypothetical protein